MDNMELLWRYQEADIALEQYEKKLKNTPTRKKLLQLKGIIKNAQTVMADVENTARVRQNSISELESQHKAVLEDIEDLAKDMSYYSECDDDELDEKEIAQLIKNSEKANEAAASIKKQLNGVKRELEKAERTIKEQVATIKAAKEKYDLLLVEYKTEVDTGDDESEQLKERFKELEAKLDPKIADEYKRIKGFRQNPVAILKDDRCEGCKMQLPSSVAINVQSSSDPIVCENCGRILIIL